jgi:acyl carrier protein
MIEKQAIRDFLSGIASKNIAIGDNDSLLATRVLDSLKMVELIVFLENEYKLSLESDELTPENLDTINSIASLLERKSAAN